MQPMRSGPSPVLWPQALAQPSEAQAGAVSQHALQLTRATAASRACTPPALGRNICFQRCDQQDTAASRT